MTELSPTANRRPAPRGGGGGRRGTAAVDETVILLHPLLPLVGVSIVMERESVSKMTELSSMARHSRWRWRWRRQRRTTGRVRAPHNTDCPPTPMALITSDCGTPRSPGREMARITSGCVPVSVPSRGRRHPRSQQFYRSFGSGQPGKLASRRRECCHSADAPSPSLLKHLLKGEGACSRLTELSPTARPRPLPGCIA